MDRRQVVAGLGGLAALGAGKAGAQSMSQDELKKRMADFEAQQAQHRAAMLQQFPFPLVKCAGADALAKWTELRAKGNGYPVVIGDAEKLAGLAETLQFNGEDGRSPEDALEKASSFRFPEDYRARLSAEAEAFRKEYANDPRFAEALDEENSESAWETYVTGDWPEGRPVSTGLTVATSFGMKDGEFTSGIAEEVHIAILPTDDWTAAFAYLGFGGWNANPFPHEHVAAFRRWNEKHDLELVGMSADELNLRCRRRPASRADAMSLARELYELCPDLLEQGAPSAEALAAQLMGDEWWYFWWD